MVYRQRSSIYILSVPPPPPPPPHSCLDTAHLLNVQNSTNCNLDTVVAPNSHRKVRCSQRSGRGQPTVDMSPARAARTSSRSAGTLHDQRQVQVLVLVVGLVWLWWFRASLRASRGFLALWWYHLGAIRLRRNLWVGRGYVVLGNREFGCQRVARTIACLKT